MNLTEVEKFEKTQSQLEGLHSEVSMLSKKKPDDALNKFKLNFVNLILTESNLILANGYLPFKDFILFSSEDLPTTSDVVMILTQYLTSFENLKRDNTKNDYWIDKGDQLKRASHSRYKYK